MIKRHPFRGQSLVEFALIFPIAFFLLTGFLDLGRAVFYYSSISNMVREGARFSIVDTNPYPSGSTPYLATINVMNDMAFGITEVNVIPENPTTCFPISCTFRSTDSDLVVIIQRIWNATTETYENISITATYTFKPVTPGITLIIGSPDGIDLVAQSTMRISGAAR